MSLIFSFLQGCADKTCNDLTALTEDRAHREEVLEWADEKIFSRSFSASEVVRGNHGPYPSPGELRQSFASEILPEFLEMYKIRLVGPNLKDFDMIFLKRDTFHGLLIARGDFLETLKSTAVKQSQFESTDERLGVLCIQRFK